MAKKGRPLKLNRTVLKRLVEAKTLGISNASAARLAGTSRPRLYVWIATGKQDIVDEKDSIYARLVKGLRVAEALVEQANVRVLADAAAGGSVKAAMHILKKRHPATWGDNPEKELDLDEGVTTSTKSYEDMSSEELTESILDDFI